MYDGRVDFWALGCLTLELLQDASPFAAADAQGVVRNILHNDIAFPNALNERSRACLGALLTREMKYRPASVIEVHEQPFFDTIDWDTLECMPPPWSPGLSGPCFARQHAAEHS